MIERTTNIQIEGKHGRPVVADVFHKDNPAGKLPVILFCHGYKGFKDWGAWNLMAEAFARKGFLFIKFNFAFNGGTVDNPIDFPDLEAFSQNTYTKELDDLEVMIDWITGGDFPFDETAKTSNLTLIGHSRGGGIAVIKAAENSRIKKLVTLAAVSDFHERFPEGAELEAWRKNGVSYVENSRTKQQMPHLFNFYNDFKENEERLTISRAAKHLKIPFLIIHGTDDPTVEVTHARRLQQWNPNAELFLLEGSDHVFGASHPWASEELPPAMHEIIVRVSQFIGF